MVAPERSHRPRSPDVHDNALPPDPVCPFCPGHESDTPEEIWRLEAANRDWRVRVVRNKFPVLTARGTPVRHVSGDGFVAMDGIGQHEVVIESRDHFGDLSRSDDAAVRAVLEAYRARYRALRAARAAFIIIFRNHGAAAGTSLTHPHSQIVATPIVPTEIRQRFDVAMQHYDERGTCLYQEILERELKDGRRIVLAGRQFVAFQPFASAFPFETWIQPRFSQASFGDINDEALYQLAAVLRAVLGGLRDVLDDPDYNLVVQSAPVGEEQSEYFVWHIRIIPRLTTPAGFELGSGICVNPSRPEETALALRRAIQQPGKGREMFLT